MSSTFLGHLVDTSQFRWEGFPLKLEYEYVARKLRETELDLQNDLTTTVYKFGVVADEITHTHYNYNYELQQHTTRIRQHTTLNNTTNKNFATQCWYTTDMTESNCNLQTCVCKYYECITYILSKK